MPNPLAFSPPLSLSPLSRPILSTCSLRPTIHLSPIHPSEPLTSMSLVYALDFDGVLCDSANETAQTAFKAAQIFWSSLQVPRDADGKPKPHLLNAMRKVRPVVETGYETMLLARLAVEMGDDFVENILQDWGGIREEVLQKWGVDKEDLMTIFGAVRDQWIAKDLDGWLEANSMFPGVVEAVNDAAGSVYVITTKQTRFCLLLLEKYGIQNISEENVFGFGTGSKISVLKKILAMKENKGKKVMFLEDRYETLEAVSLSMLGQPVDLYLATWGYNTDKAKTVASKHPFIKPMDLDQFVNKLN